jgi:large subunit ribosomal protein L9
MATEVLLMADVPELGKAGEVVKVADGYARNYLLPRELAAPVTPASLRRLEKLRKERAELAKIQLAEAHAKASKLEGVSVTIRAKTIDGEKLYGSVSVTEIADALAAQGVAIDRSQLELAEHLKQTGAYDVPVRLHPEVTVQLKVWIVKE